VGVGRGGVITCCSPAGGAAGKQRAAGEDQVSVKPIQAENYVIALPVKEPEQVQNEKKDRKRGGGGPQTKGPVGKSKALSGVMGTLARGRS